MFSWRSGFCASGNRRQKSLSWGVTQMEHVLCYTNSVFRIDRLGKTLETLRAVNEKNKSKLAHVRYYENLIWGSGSESEG